MLTPSLRKLKNFPFNPIWQRAAIKAYESCKATTDVFRNSVYSKCRLSTFVICWTNAMELRVLLKKLIITYPVKKLPFSFIQKQMCITVLQEPSGSWANWIQSTYSHLISLRSILILSSHRRLQNGSTLQVFRMKFYTYSHLSCVLHAPPIVHLDLISLIIFGEEYKLRSSLLCEFLSLLVFSPLIGANILHNTGMWLAWGRWGVHTTFWLGGLKGGDH
jgi:hypothetical protein